MPTNLRRIDKKKCDDTDRKRERERKRERKKERDRVKERKRERERSRKKEGWELMKRKIGYDNKCEREFFPKDEL